MKIGFDAKRAYHNNTGLGNYSRTLIKGLAEGYPQNEYFLFNPKPNNNLYQPSYQNVYEVVPESFAGKKFSALWRTRWINSDLQERKLNLYHGLSGELPIGIKQTGIKSVVTIHDLIFERYPHQYGAVNTFIYRNKFAYACKTADKIIAISRQTKDDLVELYHVDAGKVDVCYQSCDPVFSTRASEELKSKIRSAYNLPETFFLYVGSIIERKNLLNICKALKASRMQMPLVVVGNGKKYKEAVKKYLNEAGIRPLVYFLSEQTAVDFHLSLNKPQNLAALYQMALGMIYPSTYEGFGIPVLEALWSRLPVITSNISCLPETAGPAALFVDPFSVNDLTMAMDQMASDAELRNDLIEKGRVHAFNFTLEKCTAALMDVYKSIL